MSDILGSNITIERDPEGMPIPGLYSTQPMNIHGQPCGTGETAPAADTYACPVCFYTELSDPPEDHLICPRCGTHFGYDDCGHTHAELRALWMDGQRHWRVRAIEAANRDVQVTALMDDIEHVWIETLIGDNEPVSELDHQYVNDVTCFLQSFRERLAAILGGGAL